MGLRYVLTTIILVGLADLSSAQSVCVGDVFKLEQAKGVVREQTGFPVKGAILELHKNEFMGPVVETVRSDTDGSFAFSSHHSGKFLLVANAEAFFRISVLLKLSGKKKAGTHRLVITLGAYFKEPCGGGEVTLEK